MFAEEHKHKPKGSEHICKYKTLPLVIKIFHHFFIKNKKALVKQTEADHVL